MKFAFPRLGNLMVFGKARLAQVVTNLVGNVVQHGATDNATAVEAFMETEQIVLTVTNQGSVISVEQQQTIR